jgi:GntR family transcriptional repressor for pyruvate dehydrogenase complex
MTTTLQPIERQRVYETIVDQMRNLIDNGTWKTGQRLPSERELTEMLAVSRTSVREALRILEAMELIEIRQGEGSFIKESTSVPSRLQTLITLFKADEYTVDIMEARELLETQIAFLAAESATDEDIQALEANVERMEIKIKSGESAVEENIEFHLRLTQATGNRVLLELQQIFFQLVHETISHLYDIPGRMHVSLQQHRSILNAVKNHQPTEAHRLMLEHLRSRYSVPNRPIRD